MKTKDLIKELQEQDPSGELECVVGGEPIFFLQNLPAYYDGSLQYLIQDPDKAGSYNVVGAKFIDKGRKIEISTLTIENAIWEAPELPVDCSEVSNIERKEKKVEEWRRQRREADKEIEKRKEE